MSFSNSSLNGNEAIKCTILDILNLDCWYHIFSYVQLHDIIRSQRVSKYWRYVVGVYMRRKRTLTTKQIKRMSRTELQRLLWRHGEALTRLEITYTMQVMQLDIESNFNISADICPNLKEIEIYKNKVTHFCDLFRGSQKLQSIYLSNCNSTDSFLRKCSTSSLERLTLRFDDSRGRFLVDTNLQSLRYLQLCNCINLDQLYLSEMGKLCNLASLYINNCYFNCEAYEKLWQKLRYLINLKELSLSGCVVFLSFTRELSAHQASVEQFRYAFSRLSLLKHLHLKDNVFVTDEVLSQIAQSCKLLETLDVSFSYPPNENFHLGSDEGVIAVCTFCVNLKKLNLTRRRELSARGVVAAASQARSLERLIVRYLDEIDTESLADILHTCTSLRELDVQCCNVTPEVMDIAVDKLKIHPRPLVLLVSTDIYQQSDWTIPKYSLLTVSISDLSRRKLNK